MRCRWSGGIRLAVSLTRPVSGGMSLAAAQASGSRRRRRISETRRLISLPLPAQLVGELVRVVGLDLHAVPLQQLAAGADRLDQRGTGPAAPDPRGQLASDRLPGPFLHLLMDAGVGEQHDPALEQGDEEEDAGPVAGMEDLLVEESDRGAPTGSQIEDVL